MTAIERAVKDAIEGGFKLQYYTGPALTVGLVTNLIKIHLESDGIYKLLLDPTFWQAVGKTRGWGEWNGTVNDVVHEWELDCYLPNTDKTPQYYCKKCFAKKEGVVIFYDLYGDQDWGSEVTSFYLPKYLRAHGFKQSEAWRAQQRNFIDHLADGLTIEDALLALEK